MMPTYALPVSDLIIVERASFRSLPILNLCSSAQIVGFGIQTSSRPRRLSYYEQPAKCRPRLVYRPRIGYRISDVFRFEIATFPEEPRRQFLAFIIRVQ